MDNNQEILTDDIEELKTGKTIPILLKKIFTRFMMKDIRQATIHKEKQMKYKQRKKNGKNVNVRKQFPKKTQIYTQKCRSDNKIELETDERYYIGDYT